MILRRAFAKKLPLAHRVCSYELNLFATVRRVVVIAGDKPKETRSHAKILIDEGRPSIEIVEGALPPVKVNDDMLNQVFSTLTSLGYWPENRAPKTREGVAAIAKFFYVNKLGPLMVYPLSHTVSQAFEHVKESPSISWSRDPRDLMYLVPLGSAGADRRQARFGGPDSAKLVAGGGPRILHTSTNMIEQVLAELGYWENDGSLGPFDVALSIFCSMNVGKLQGADIELQFAANGACECGLEGQKRLAELFLSQSCFQEWKIPPRDDAVRKFLKARKNIGLSAIDAPREEVSEAMDKFLERSSRSYHEAVFQMQQLFLKDKNERQSASTSDWKGYRKKKNLKPQKAS